MVLHGFVTIAIAAAFVLITGCGPELVDVQEIPDSCLSDSSESADCDLESFGENDDQRTIYYRSVSDLERACEQRCSRTTRSLHFSRMEGLTTLQGFRFIQEMPGFGVQSLRDVEVIDLFHGVDSMTGFFIKENPELEIIEPLASLEILEYGANFEGNPKLKDLRALANVRQIGEIGGEYEPGLKLSNNSSLVDMTGLEKVEVIGGRFQIRDHYNLESMRGLDSLGEVETLAIVNSDDDPEYVKLNSLAGLESLRRIHGALVIQNAPNLRRCEAEALVAQLEEPPEEVILVNLNDEPCD
ncbi:hypothetical protein FRC91_10905 [Bradymonadales bacterium TMQ1]|nr:hypothetical protein FRC91_10905 [Bradymonadales bacterium TMQ1]